MTKITYSNGHREEERALIERCIGMGRGVRKSAAMILGLKFKDYQKEEKEAMKKENIFNERLKDVKRRK